MMKKLVFGVAGVLLLSPASWSQENEELTRDYMIIVGSTTIYPFSSAVVDRFVENTGLKKPMV